MRHCLKSMGRITRRCLAIVILIAFGHFVHFLVGEFFHFANVDHEMLVAGLFVGGVGEQVEAFLA